MIVVATTLHAYVTDQAATSQSWLLHAEAIRDSVDDEVRFFAALEVDARGLEPFGPLIELLIAANGGDHLSGHLYYTFSFDDHATEIGTANRLRRITMGQNICNEYADSVGASHLLFCAADCAPPPDVLPKRLEMDHPIVGPEIPTYCLSGPVPNRSCPNCDGTGWVVRSGVNEQDQCPDHRTDLPLYPFPVQEHMASAACVLLGREVFTKLRWRTDRDAGMTDDPCLHHDALHLLGLPTYVRKDVVAKHYPEAIGAIETRGHDRTVYR